MALIRDIAELVKFRIVLLSTVLSAGGFCLPSGTLGSASGSDRIGSGWEFLGNLLGTALVVASASLFNMVLESRSDAVMERTRLRPLPSGRIRVSAAYGAAVGSGGLGLMVLFGISVTAGFVSAAALVLYAFVYTPLKRRTPWAFLLGLGPGAAPPLIGWAAARHTVWGNGAWVFLWLLAWQIPHIMAIHAYLRRDYARSGISVLPGLYGDRLSMAFTLPFTVTSALLAPWIVAAAGMGTAWMYLFAGLGFLLTVGHLRALLAREILPAAVGFKRLTLWYAGCIAVGQIFAEGVQRIHL